MRSRTLAYLSAAVFAATVIMCATVTNAQMITDGLVGYWPLDEDTIKGKTVEDVWGDNEGELAGNPKQRDGKVAGAMEFSGNDSVDIIWHGLTKLLRERGDDGNGMGERRQR